MKINFKFNKKIKPIHILILVIVLLIIFFSIKKYSQTQENFSNDYNSITRSSLDVYYPEENISTPQTGIKKSINDIYRNYLKPLLTKPLQYENPAFVNKPRILLKATAKACPSSTTSPCTGNLSILLTVSKVFSPTNTKTVPINLDTSSLNSSDGSSTGMFVAIFTETKLNDFANYVINSTQTTEDTIKFGTDNKSIREYLKNDIFLYNTIIPAQCTAFLNKLKTILPKTYFVIGTKGAYVGQLTPSNTPFNQLIQFIKGQMNARLIDQANLDSKSYIYQGYRNKDGIFDNNDSSNLDTEVLDATNDAKLKRKVGTTMADGVYIGTSPIQFTFTKTGTSLPAVPPTNPDIKRNRVQIASNRYSTATMDKIINFSYNNQESDVYLQNKDIQTGPNTNNPMNFVLIPVSENTSLGYYIATADLPKALYLTAMDGGKLGMSILKNDLSQRWEIIKTDSIPTNNLYRIKSILTGQFLTCFPTGGYLEPYQGKVYLDNTDNHVWKIVTIQYGVNDFKMSKAKIDEITSIEGFDGERKFFSKQDVFKWNGSYIYRKTTDGTKNDFLTINLNDNGVGKISFDNKTYDIKANTKTFAIGQIDKNSWITLQMIDPKLGNPNGGLTSIRNSIRIKANIVDSNGVENIGNTNLSFVMNSYIQKVTDPSKPLNYNDYLESQGINVTLDAKNGIGLPKANLVSDDLSKYIKTFNNDGSCPCDKYCRWSGEVRSQVFNNRFNQKSPYYGWPGAKAAVAEVVRKNKKGDIIDGSRRFLNTAEKYVRKSDETFSCYCERDNSAQGRFVNSCGVSCNDFNALTNCTLFISQNIRIQAPFGSLMNFTMNNNLENLKPTPGTTQIQIFEANREFAILFDDGTKKEYALTPYCLAQNNYQGQPLQQTIFPGRFNSPSAGWNAVGVFYAVSDATFNTLSTNEKAKYVPVTNYSSWIPWRTMSYYNQEPPRFDKNCLGAYVNIYFVYRILNMPETVSFKAVFPVFYYWGSQKTNERISRVVSRRASADGKELFVTVENTAGERREFSVLKSDNWKFAIDNAYLVCADKDWWDRNNTSTQSSFTFYVRNMDKANMTKIYRGQINSREKYVFGIKKKYGFIDLADAVKLSKAFGCEIAPVSILNKFSAKNNYSFDTNILRNWVVNEKNKTVIGLYNKTTKLRILTNFTDANLLCYGPFPLNLPDEYELNGAIFDGTNGNIIQNPYTNGPGSSKVQFFDTNQGNLTWPRAGDFCASKNMRLCSSKEYCPNGKLKNPEGGMRKGDRWAPVNDNDGNKNNWISIGDYDPSKRLCRTHLDSLGNSPAWGNDPNRFYSYKGMIGCCPK
jgi:hypothetical protein